MNFASDAAVLHGSNNVMNQYGGFVICKLESVKKDQMDIAEIILFNEAQNDGYTIYLYKEDDKYWYAYDISAYLLSQLVNKVKTQEYVFDSYQIKMFRVMLTEEDVGIIRKNGRLHVDMMKYKIFFYHSTINYSTEDYLLWIKGLVNF